jgi:phage gp37-like protein
MSMMLEEQNRNLEAQLIALYQEKQEIGDYASMAESLRNLEQQLVALYAEREAQPGDVDSMRETMKSLEEQLVALYEEKAQMLDRMASIDRRLEDMKVKSKAIGAALLEAALFGDEKRVA